MKVHTAHKLKRFFCHSRVIYKMCFLLFSDRKFRKSLFFNVFILFTTTGGRFIKLCVWSFFLQRAIMTCTMSQLNFCSKLFKIMPKERNPHTNQPTQNIPSSFSKGVKNLGKCTLYKRILKKLQIQLLNSSHNPADKVRTWHQFEQVAACLGRILRLPWS